MNKFKLLIKGFAMMGIVGLLSSCSGGGGGGGGGAEAVVTTIAGDGTANYLDGIGTAAQFNAPTGITNDGINLYVASGNNKRVRQIDIATGVVSTFAGNGNNTFLDGTGLAAQLPGPTGLTNDGTDLYLTDTDGVAGSQVRVIGIATANVVSIAGDPNTRGVLDGLGVAAQFNNPQGITTDGINIYVADTYNHSIRKVDSVANVTTLAGNGIAGFVDDTGVAAQFNSPFGITTDGTNLYVADTANNRIRQFVIASGVVTTLAGDGTAGFLDGTGIAARFNTPLAITTDGVNLYVSDNHRIRQVVITTGVVSTLAGDGTPGYLDGTGTATKFNVPWGITVDGQVLYVNDKGGHRVRRIQLP
jgi:hypothetical protein